MIRTHWELFKCNFMFDLRLINIQRWIFLQYNVSWSPDDFVISIWVEAECVCEMIEKFRSCIVFVLKVKCTYSLATIKLFYWSYVLTFYLTGLHLKRFFQIVVIFHPFPVNCNKFWGKLIILATLNLLKKSINSISLKPNHFCTSHPILNSTLLSKGLLEFVTY